MDIHGKKNYKRKVNVIAVKRKESHLSTLRCNTKHTHNRSQVEHMNDIKRIRIKTVPQLQVSVRSRGNNPTKEQSAVKDEARDQFRRTTRNVTVFGTSTAPKGTVSIIHQ